MDVAAANGDSGRRKRKVNITNEGATAHGTGHKKLRVAEASDNTDVKVEREAVSATHFKRTAALDAQPPTATAKSKSPMPIPQVQRQPRATLAPATSVAAPAKPHVAKIRKKKKKEEVAGASKHPSAPTRTLAPGTPPVHMTPVPSRKLATIVAVTAKKAPAIQGTPRLKSILKPVRVLAPITPHTAPTRPVAIPLIARKVALKRPD
jgi:hypothetical protein